MTRISRSRRVTKDNDEELEGRKMGGEGYC
jgi:hypothetical protein